ncbi:hypothetical protein ORJ66_12560 [Pseudoalteromonas tunicata]|uniref:endonuclease/exonuclease/phosphatase family protein n=1 Tax=Pseudoalteromonas tunicata TaxID=314281 RepID=UPI00273D0BD1|nr:endonuclease/exonuclease/phosphatase family protein [Pseudoalteromonas tunicata]MDP5213877.1 hypothetical protein [Pseudoalteromonas tunicata]
MKKAAAGLLLILLCMLFVLIILPYFSISGKYWLLDILISFQPVYTLLCVITLITLFLFHKRLATYLMPVFVIATYGNFIQYLPKVAHISPAEYTGEITIFQANIAYENKNPQALFQYLNSLQHDITVLFEVNDTYREEFGTLAKGKFNVGYAEIEGLPAGIGIITRFPIIHRKIHYFAGKSALIVELTLLIEGKLINFYALHPPSPRNKETWQIRNNVIAQLQHLVSKQPERLTLITADLNTTVWSTHFAQFSDITSCMALNGLYGSWPSKLAVNNLTSWMSVAIDHCFMGSDFRLLKFETQEIPGSDHLALQYTAMLKK